MKKVTKFFMAALLAGMCNFGYAQDCLNAPTIYEPIIEYVSRTDNGCESTLGRDYLINKRYNEYLNDAKKKYPDKQVDIRDLKLTKKRVL